MYQYQYANSGPGSVSPGSICFVKKVVPGSFYQGREIFGKTEGVNLPSTLLKLLEFLHRLFFPRRPGNTFVYHFASQLCHLFTTLSLSVTMMIPMSK